MIMSRLTTFGRVKVSPSLLVPSSIGIIFSSHVTHVWVGTSRPPPSSGASCPARRLRWQSSNCRARTLQRLWIGSRIMSRSHSALYPLWDRIKLAYACRTRYVGDCWLPVVAAADVLLHRRQFKSSLSGFRPCSLPCISARRLCIGILARVWMRWSLQRRRAMLPI